MAFTYNGTLTTDLDKARFEIGDVTSGAGVKPDGTNITDAELNALITQEGSWGAGAARACEILARHWSRVPDNASTGQRSRANQQVAHFREAAKDLREQYGGGRSNAFSTGFQRDDGYHINNEFDFDEDNTSEFGARRTIYIRTG